MVLAQPPVPRIEVGDALKWAWAKTFANPLIIAWIPLSLLAMALVVSDLSAWSVRTMARSLPRLGFRWRCSGG